MANKRREVRPMDAAFCDLLQTRAGPDVQEKNFVIGRDGRLVMVDPAVERIINAPHVLLADSAPRFAVDPHQRGAVTFGVVETGHLTVTSHTGDVVIGSIEADEVVASSGSFAPVADEDWEGVYRTLARGDDAPESTEDVDGVMRTIARGRRRQSRSRR